MLLGVKVKIAWEMPVRASVCDVRYRQLYVLGYSIDLRVGAK